MDRSLRASPARAGSPHVRPHRRSRHARRRPPDATALCMAAPGRVPAWMREAVWPAAANQVAAVAYRGSSSSRYQSPGMAPRPIPVRWLSHRQISIRGVSIAGSSPVAHGLRQRRTPRQRGLGPHPQRGVATPVDAARGASRPFGSPSVWLARDELNDGDLTSGFPSPVAIDRELGEDTIGEIPKPL